ncbi:MAG: hypothetical protein OMM_10995 [Candidatus Magnetoglobus multicellularis str. Araruama]|uniref:Uncharacterized protein n=1 Tax=Candidatus Magnetoglobus multicellularis str. Araruama TaxID=890399 RepID=A0A1V1NZP7_9BACT|nr:MAG: hypothetical protein OMM_10995 [Candidatus Magnetoglobus multicellularis str. Araruama]
MIFRITNIHMETIYDINQTNHGSDIKDESIIVNFPQIIHTTLEKIVRKGIHDIQDSTKRLEVALSDCLATQASLQIV